MSLSISANGGNGLAGLLRQARPAKLAEDRGSQAEPAASGASARPVGRAGIDSTGSGTAQISAALTVYLSKLGGSDEPTSPPATSTRSQVQGTGRTGTAPSRSGAADLLRVLDAYGSNQRLTA